MDAREHEFDDFGIAITIFLDAWFTAVFSVTPVMFSYLSRLLETITHAKELQFKS